MPTNNRCRASFSVRHTRVADPRLPDASGNETQSFVLHDAVGSEATQPKKGRELHPERDMEATCHRWMWPRDAWARRQTAAMHANHKREAGVPGCSSGCLNDIELLKPRSVQTRGATMLRGCAYGAAPEVPSGPTTPEPLAGGGGAGSPRAPREASEALHGAALGTARFGPAVRCSVVALEELVDASSARTATPKNKGHDEAIAKRRGHDARNSHALRARAPDITARGGCASKVLARAPRARSVLVCNRLVNCERACESSTTGHAQHHFEGIFSLAPNAVLANRV